ncbi:MAG: type II toxin-antitoxin system VapC family toxin [Terriglobia bacterium]
MSNLLLDTDVFSFLFKDHPLAEAYRPHVKGHTLAISFMTVAELYQGAYRAGWGTRQIERLESRIAAYVVIPSSHAISKRWGEVRFIRRAQPISPEDAWVAAAALQQGYPLVTHNAKDFQSIPGLNIITESQ